MEHNPEREEVVSYYDEHTKNKLNDYIRVNPRIEFGWETIKRMAPVNPSRILEVGCGVGGLCARMHNHWPGAQITGIDISRLSIQIADKLFANKRVSFKQSILLPDTFEESFDLIIFMDVYEHIAVSDRPDVHAALSKILRNKGRIILTVPTPHLLKWSLIHKPETMQPVDEHISYEVIGRLAAGTGTEVMLYEIKSVWNTGDYAHAVLEKNDDFESEFFVNKPVTTAQRGKRILSKAGYKLGSLYRRLSVRRKLS